MGAVSPAFANAVAFLSDSISTHELAHMLAGQLAHTVPGYGTARADFQWSLTDDERIELDSLQLGVLGPLRELSRSDGAVVRLVIDGLDKIPGGSELSIRRALNELATDPRLACSQHLYRTDRYGIACRNASHRNRCNQSFAIDGLISPVAGFCRFALGDH